MGKHFIKEKDFHRQILRVGSDCYPRCQYSSKKKVHEMVDLMVNVFVQVDYRGLLLFQKAPELVVVRFFRKYVTVSILNAFSDLCMTFTEPPMSEAGRIRRCFVEVLVGTDFPLVCQVTRKEALSPTQCFLLRNCGLVGHWW
jgi:hypothetical protein